MQQQLDAEASAALKDRGQQLALDFSGEWAEEVVLAFRAWAAVEKARGLRTCTIEQFRASTTLHPASHKAWGALPKLLCRHGLIAPSLDAEGEPRYQRAAAPRTHSHPVRIWKFT